MSVRPAAFRRADEELEAARAVAFVSDRRTTPHDAEAERSVLGSLLIKPAAFGDVAALLRTDDFLVPAHREIFEAMLSVDRRQQPIDVVLIADELRVRGMLSRLEGGELYLMGLSNAVPTAENIGHYAGIVNEKATRRQLIAVLADLQSQAHGDVGEFDQFLAEAERQVARVAARRNEAPLSARTICMASIEAQPVKWLWPGRMPAGMLCVLDGPPGLGKSSVVMDLTARITTGRPWPGAAGHSPPRDVILLGHEDSPEHTIRPRLDSARADVNRVHLLTEIAGRLPRFPDDVGELERLVTSTGAALIVVDPISAYIGEADLHRDNEVRGALTPLVAVAERSGVTILLLRHLRKTSGGGALNAGLGSIAITALARASMMLLKDPDDEAGEARILTWPKLSVGAQPASLRWHFAPTGEGQPPRIEWDALSCSLSADDILSRQEASGRSDRRGAVDETGDFLRDALAEGPVPSLELERRATEAGHSRSAYDRARRSVGVVAAKRGNTWVSELPQPRTSAPRHAEVDVLGVVEVLPPPGPQSVIRTSSFLRDQGPQGHQEPQGIHAGAGEVLPIEEDVL